MSKRLLRRTACAITALASPTVSFAQVAATSEAVNTTTERLTARLQDLAASLPLLGIAAVVVVLFWLLSRWLGRADWPFQRIDNPLLRGVVRQIVQTIVVIVGVLVALEIMDAMALAGAVMGTAGIVGLAVGFAFKDVVENYLAGVLLSMRQPFAANDLVDVEGYQGKVVRLTPRATILMTTDGNHVRIPNATVFKSSMVNYTRNPLRRFDFVVGVGSGEDLRGAQTLGVDALRAVPGLLADPAPSAILEPPGDSSIGVHFFAWVNQSDTSLGRAKSAAIRVVTQTLDAAGIDMPEPIHRVRFDGQQMTITETDAPDDQPASTTRPKNTRSSNAAVVEVEAEETAADDEIDAQIAQQRQLSGGQDGEENLLNDSSPKE